MKDPSKPDGEAVNADGSLKPADQMKWVDSPTEDSESHPPILGFDEDMGDASEPDENPDIYMPPVDHWQDLDEDDKVDEEDEQNKEDEEGQNKEDDNIEIDVSEEEDVDDEAEKRYWETKTKEGVRKVCLVISEEVIT
jgi:hypothetical protein